MVELTPAFGRYLRKGWKIIPLPNGWRLLTADGAVEIYLQETSHWFCFSRLLTDVESTALNIEQRCTDLYQQLLLLNRYLFMVRFALDEQGQILLQTEVPRHNDHSLLLETALDAICRPVPTNLRILRDDYHRQTVTPAVRDYMSREVFFHYLHSIKLQMWRLGIPLADSHIKHLMYKGYVREFDVFFTANSNWSYFELPIIGDETLKMHGADNVVVQSLYDLLLRYLLHLNYYWYMAKIALDEDNQILILLELPTNALDVPLFQLAASTIATYIDQYGQEVLAMFLLEPEQPLSKLVTLPG